MSSSIVRVISSILLLPLLSSQPTALARWPFSYCYKLFNCSTSPFVSSRYFPGGTSKTNGPNRTRLHQLLRQCPVVGHQQQTFAGIVQPPHRIHTLRAFFHQLHNCQASFRIADRGHVPFRLVQQKIEKPLRPLQQFSIHADLVPLRVGLRTQLRNHGSVESHPPRRNQLLRLATRRNPASRHDFLQSFGSHRSSQCYSGMWAALARSSPAASRNSFLAPALRFWRWGLYSSLSKNATALSFEGHSRITRICGGLRSPSIRSTMDVRAKYRPPRRSTISVTFLM